MSDGPVQTRVYGADPIYLRSPAITCSFGRVEDEVGSARAVDGPHALER